MFVKPRCGYTIRDPATRQPLPEAGRRVEPSSFWLRRLAAGDVEMVEGPKPLVKKPAEKDKA